MFRPLGRLPPRWRGFSAVLGTVGFAQGKELGVHANGDFGRDAQEIFAILARVVGDAANDAFLVEQVVGERGDGAHLNAGEDESAALAQRFQRGGNDFASGSEDDCGVELGGRLGGGAARPFGSELKCELLLPRIPGRRIHFHIPVHRPLNGNLGGGAKSLKAQLAAGLNSRKTQGAKPDDSGAEQRSALLIGKLLRDGRDTAWWSNK